MAPGQAWLFESLAIHSITNTSTVDRIHLIFDTPGSGTLFDLVQCARAPLSQVTGFDPRMVAYEPQSSPTLRFETTSAEIILPRTASTASFTISSHDS